MVRFKFRKPRSGEAPTHFYIARLGSVVTWELMEECRFTGYCVEPLVVELGE
jgi:hypothetical protein